MQFNLSNQGSNGSLSVFFADGTSKTLANTHPNYVATVTYLAEREAAGQPHDEDHVRGLVDPAVGIGRVLQEEFGDRLTFDLHRIYLDGVQISGPLAQTLKQRLLAGEQDWLRFAKFLVNLESNPSHRAKEAVWKWVEGNGLTITEDGRFLGYKAVLDNGLSKSRGPNNFVNGVLLNNGDECQVPHEVGSVISKRRADVDDNPGGGCSVGLHVGTLAYAQSFAPRLMTVAVNPRDVVSASDYDLSYKIRVCEYEVISLADPAQFATGSYDLHPVVEVDVTPDEVVSVPKSAERLQREADVDSLTDAERDVYQVERAAGATHDDAMAATRPVPSKDLTLAENAALLPSLKRDLEDVTLGHKPLARRWEALTSESSVRRYRKSNGIVLNLSTRIKDAVS